MSLKKIENDFAKFSVEDGVIHFVYKQGEELDLQGAIQVVADRLKAQGNTSFPIICDIRGLKSVNKEARDYLAKEGSSKVSAVALVVGSPARKVMSNFYLAVNKPDVPTRLFISEEDALTYLHSLEG